MRDAAREYTERAIAVLGEALEDADRKVQIKAAEVLLDRAWGRPPQAIVGDAEFDPVQTAVRVVFGRD